MPNNLATSQTICDAIRVIPDGAEVTVEPHWSRRVPEIQRGGYARWRRQAAAAKLWARRAAAWSPSTISDARHPLRLT
jgi:hypothetical protein